MTPLIFLIPVVVLTIAIVAAAAAALADWYRSDGKAGTWTTLTGAFTVMLFFALGGTQFLVVVAGAVLIWIGGAITPGRF